MFRSNIIIIIKLEVKDFQLPTEEVFILTVDSGGLYHTLFNS